MQPYFNNQISNIYFKIYAENSQASKLNFSGTENITPKNSSKCFLVQCIQIRTNCETKNELLCMKCYIKLNLHTSKQISNNHHHKFINFNKINDFVKR